MALNKIIYERNDTRANCIANMPAYYTALLSDQTYELVWKAGAHSGTDMYIAAPQKFWDGSDWNHSVVSFGKVNFKSTGMGDGTIYGSIYPVGSTGLRIDGDGSSAGKIGIRQNPDSCYDLAITGNTKVTGSLDISSISNYGATLVNVLVTDTGGLIAKRTLAELRTDIGANAHGVTSGTIPKSSGTTTWGNSLLVETATGIGVGSAPSYFMHVKKDQANLTAFVVENATDDVSSYIGVAARHSANFNIGFYQSTASNAIGLGGVNANGMGYIVSYNTNGVCVCNYSNTPIYFSTNNAVRMRINAAGGVETDQGIFIKGASGHTGVGMLLAYETSAYILCANFTAGTDITCKVACSNFHIMTNYGATPASLVIGSAGTTADLTDKPGAIIWGKILRIVYDKTPASNASGYPGEICWDTGYLYVCTATNTWKRVALTGGY